MSGAPLPAPPDTFPEGMALVVGFICLLFTLIATIEFWCELVGWRSIARSLDEWSLLNRWFAGALLLVAGIFFAHFLLNRLPCDDELRPDGGPLPARCVTPPKSELLPGNYTMEAIATR